VPLLGLFSAASRCAAQTPCGDNCATVINPGNVSGTWTADKSPYCIVGDISIGDLTIKPGVCVLVDGPYTIEVLVRLKIMGSADQPVTITSKEPNLAWHGILFNSVGSGSEFNYCTISGSDSSAVRIVSGAAPVLRSCTISDNTTTGHGGGVDATITDGDLVLDHCTLSGNSAKYDGGGVWANMKSGGTLVLDHCLVNGNVGNNEHKQFDNYFGGGVRIQGNVDITDCTFDGNRIYGQLAGGSALWCAQGNVTMRNIVVVNNHSEGSTGAVLGSSNGQMSLINSVIACNTDNAGNYGGVLLIDSDGLIENCTIARNDHHGVYHTGQGQVAVHNSIVFFNNNETEQVSGTMTVTFSDVQGGAPGEGNISLNPAFKGNGCNPCSLGILAYSPVVDAGDPAAEFDDQCRPPSYGTSRNDMGAYGGPGACGWPQTCYSDCDGTCSLDLFDFLCFVNAFNSEDPYSDCDGSGVFDLFDFLCFVNDFNKGC